MENKYLAMVLAAILAIPLAHADIVVGPEIGVFVFWAYLAIVGMNIIIELPVVLALARWKQRQTKDLWKCVCAANAISVPIVMLVPFLGMMFFGGNQITWQFLAAKAVAELAAIAIEAWVFEQAGMRRRDAVVVSVAANMASITISLAALWIFRGMGTIIYILGLIPGIIGMVFAFKVDNRAVKIATAAAVGIAIIYAAAIYAMNAAPHKPYVPHPSSMEDAVAGEVKVAIGVGITQASMVFLPGEDLNVTAVEMMVAMKLCTHVSEELNGLFRYENNVVKYVGNNPFMAEIVVDCRPLDTKGCCDLNITRS